MTKQELTQEKALENWTEFQRLISVGAFEERSTEHFEAGTWPEDGVEESVEWLEMWASNQGLEFRWNADSKTWRLVSIEQGHDTIGGYE
jgi:hypothetical protein